MSGAGEIPPKKEKKTFVPPHGGFTPNFRIPNTKAERRELQDRQRAAKQAVIAISKRARKQGASEVLSGSASEPGGSASEPGGSASEPAANDRVEQMRAVQAEALSLFAAKNADYGDAFASYGVPGVLMRMSDKLMRFQKISRTGIQLVNDERLRDTLLDLHNYAAMALLLLDEDTVADTQN